MGSKPSTSERLSEAGAARALGISRQAVQQWVKRGLLKKGNDGRLDPAEVEAVRAIMHPSAKSVQNAEQAAPPETAEPAHTDLGITSYHVARTLREAAEARMAQLRLEEMAGSLVRLSELEPKLARVFSDFREGILQIPARVSSVLAAETDAQRVYQILDEELCQALTHLTAPYTVAKG